MNRRDLILAALAPSNRHSYTPVQVQKLFFLIDRNIPQAVGGPHFQFEPYDYGPFDQAVYQELETLTGAGLVETEPVDGRSWCQYRLTEAGQALGEKALDTLNPKIRNYVVEVNSFVRRLSFSQLVRAIYNAYPEMKEKSVFRE